MTLIQNKAIPAMAARDPGQSFARYIAVIWQFLIIVGGLVVFLYLIWGALNWIFSGSNPDRLKRAKDEMFNGLFGLAILILSYALVQIISRVTGLNILNPNWPTF